jgi:outer membrane protein assembly factor BamA
MNANKFLFFSLFFIFITVLSSCSSTKFVPEGNYLLDKVEIKMDEKEFKGKDLTNYVRQEPNFKVFGLYRLYLSIYNLSGRDSTKWVNKTLRRIGESPVIYDPFQTYRSERELQKYVQTKGFINANVTSGIETNKKKAKVTYYITANEPYRVRNIHYNFSVDPAIDSLMQQRGLRNTLLKEGMLFDIDVLNEERERITRSLRRQGYYYINREYISYTADSTLGSNQVDITLNLLPFTETLQDGRTEDKQHKKYTIRRINVLTLKNARSFAGAATTYDTIQYSPTLHIYFEDRPLIRPKVIEEELRIYSGYPYNDILVERTYARFNSLGIIRSTNIQFNDLQNDKNELDCSIILTPAKSQSFSLDIEGTNSWGDLEFAGNIGYQHKNIFRGSEILGIRFRYAQEANSELKDILKNHTIDIGGETSLTFPRFMFPLLSKSFKQRINAQTEFKVSYNYQIRPQTYERTIATMGMRYIWNMRRFYHYTFDILDLNYVKISTEPSFDSLYSAPRYSLLRYSYSDHLILSSGFTIMFDNQMNPSVLNKTSYRFSVETAGNLLYALSSVTNSSKNTNGLYEIGNIPYSQYVKGESSYSYNRYIDKKNRIVYHIGFGIAYPYGNAQMVPFEKRFFGGGANSVRGWSVRTLGPGSFSYETKDDFIKQSGDIKLDMNIEYRSKLFWKMELAAFIDAGNIWTIKDYDSQPGGVFKFDKFYEQIALAYGLGIRFDFTYFLIRFDVGSKAHDPSKESERWRFRNFKWSEDFAFHFAIGYPF